VVFHDRARYEELPSVLRPFDAFLLPYAINDYTKDIRPAKLYECFASGKPVFATPIASLYRYDGLIRFGSTGASIAALVAAYESQSAAVNAGEHDARVEEARRHDWDRVVEQELAWLDPPEPVPLGAPRC
jgi:glycosyltransferase involved in cell wall biosynthesis